MAVSAQPSSWPGKLLLRGWNSVHLNPPAAHPSIPQPTPTPVYSWDSRLCGDEGRSGQGDWAPGKGAGAGELYSRLGRPGREGEGVGMDQKQGLAVSRLTLSPLPVIPRQVR